MTDAIANGHLIITSGAGFGKTELLVSWRQANLADRTIYVLSLGTGESAPDAFCAAVAAAIGAPGTGTNGAPFAGDILSHIESWEEDAVLIIDRTEVIADMPSEEVLRSILGTRSALRVILAGRRPIGVDLAAIARGEVTELVMDDLRFSWDETNAILQGGDIGWLPDCTAVQSLTGGWPIAVMLYRQACLAQDREASEARFQAMMPRIGGYIDANYLQCAPDDRDAAIGLALLDKVTIGCADFVFGIGTGREMIDRAERAGLIEHRPASSSWRFAHPLLRDHLVRFSYDEEPHTRKLHDRAARWFSANDLPISAINHVLKTRDWIHLGQIIEAAGGWRLAFRWRNQDPKWDGLHKIFQQIPVSYVDQSPRLKLMQMFMLSSTGDFPEARRSRSVLRDKIIALGDPEVIRDAAFLGICFHLLEDQVPGEDDVTKLETALLEIYEGDRLAAAMVENGVCLAEIDLGNAIAAVRAADRAIKIYGQLDMLQSVVMMQYYQAQAFTMDARLDDAMEVTNAGILIASDHLGQRSDSVTQGRVMLADIAIERCRYDEADELLRDAFSAIEILGKIGFRTAFFGRIRTTAARNGLTSAYGEVLECIKFARRQKLVRLERLALICWAEQMCRFGYAEEALDIVSRLRLAADADPRDVHANLAAAHVEAWASIELGRPSDAMDVLDSARLQIGPRYFDRALIDWHILRSMAAWSLDRPGEAIADMRAALQLAAPSRVLRPFIDRRNAVSKIIRKLRQQRSVRTVDRRLERFMGLIVGEAYKAATSAVGSDPETVLSIREREIVELLGRGLSNKEVGRSINLSENTIKWHLRNLFQKFGVTHREELSRAWLDTRKRVALPLDDIYAGLPADPDSRTDIG